MAIEVVPTVLYSGMMGVVVSSLVRTVNSLKDKQTTYLFGLLTLLLIHIIGELYIYSGAYRYAPGIAGFQLPVRMLMGPALYFYAFVTMFPGNKLSLKKHVIALSGLVVVILAMLPFIFIISPEQKLALANPATRDPALWRIAISTCLFTAIAFIGFTFAYLIAAFRLHARHRKQLMDKYSAIEKRAMNWFRVMLILWGLVWFAYAVNYALTFFGFRWLAIDFALPLFEFVVLVSFTHFALGQPKLSLSEKSSTQNEKTRETIIPREKMQQIADKLTATMTEKELFKDEDLSLNSLSTSVSVSENYISETLSQFMQTNFFEFVNRYRIEEAKKLLMTTDMLVSSIAYEVGFNSKSTFNSAFKKFVGMTPTAYKKSA